MERIGKRELHFYPLVYLRWGYPDVSVLMASARPLERNIRYLKENIPLQEAGRCTSDEIILSRANKSVRLFDYVAEKLASGPAVAFRYMKENLNRAMHGDVDDCLDLEATHHIHCGQTHDHKNAVKAFVEKKEPIFEGK